MLPQFTAGRTIIFLFENKNKHKKNSNPKSLVKVTI